MDASLVKEEEQVAANEEVEEQPEVEQEPEPEPEPEKEPEKEEVKEEPVKEEPAVKEEQAAGAKFAVTNCLYKGGAEKLKSKVISLLKNKDNHWVKCVARKRDVQICNVGSTFDEAVSMFSEKEAQWLYFKVHAVDVQGSVESTREKFVSVFYSGNAIPVSRRTWSLQATNLVERSKLAEMCSARFLDQTCLKSKGVEFAQQLLKSGGAHPPSRFTVCGEKITKEQWTK